MDRDTGEQCATLRLRCMPGVFGHYVYRVCRWFNNAQLAVERNGAGIGSLEALQTDGYPPGLMYHRPVAGDQDPLSRSDKLGWMTDEISRQQLISLLDDAIRQSTIYVHDPTTITELLTFVINPKGKAEAQQGTHDDCVIALALAVVVMARMPAPIKPQAPPQPPRVGYYNRPAPQEPERRGTLVKVLR